MKFKLLRHLAFVFIFLLHYTSLCAQWVAHPSPTQYGLQSVQILNEQEAFIGGSDGIFRTKDGGNSWKRYKLQANTIDSVQIEFMQTNQIHFTSSKVGYSAGWNFFNHGMVLKTVDGGINWKIVYTGPSLGDKLDYTFRAITFVNSNVGYIAGTKGTVLKTVDAGETWASVNVSITASELEESYFNSVYFLNENEGFVAGSGLYQTKDGGKTWQKLVPEQFEGVQFNDIHFFNTNDAIASLYIPQYSALERVPLYKTSDGGRNWTPVMQPGLQYESMGIYTIHDLHFADSRNGYAVGERVAWKTTDGGETWGSLNLTPDATLEAVSFYGSSLGMMVGNNGRIYKSTNLHEATRPIVKFTLPATNTYCPGQTYTFQNKGPENYSYKWYVDNKLVATSYNLITSFEEDKGYEIKLVAEHNGLTDFAIRYIRTAKSESFTKFRFAYYDSNYLYCKATPLNLTIYGAEAYYYYNQKIRHELWTDGKLIEVVEDKSGEIRFKQLLLDKTTTFTVKATVETFCETFTQEESITFNVAPTPDLTLEVQEVEDIVCPSSTEGFKLIVKNSQAGFMYAVKHSDFGGTADFDTAHEGNGGDLVITTVFTGQNEYQNTTPTSLSEREIVVYAWSKKCSNYDARPLQDKAVMRTSNFNLKLEVIKDHLLVGEPLKVNNLSVADMFRWIVTDGLIKTEYTTAQLPEVSFATPGIKVVELFTSKHGKCTSSTRFDVVVGTAAPIADLTICVDQDISADPNKVDDYVNNRISKVIASHVDKDGFVYTTGSQKGRLFLSKYDSSGKLLWTRNHWSGGYQGHSLGSAITTDNEGNVYLGGHSSTSQFTFGSISLEGSTYFKYLSFIIKLDAEGNTQWAIKNDTGWNGGTSWLNMITDLAIDKNQNVYAVIKSSAHVDITFPDGSRLEGNYRSDQGRPKFDYEFVAPTLLLKTDKEGNNLGITVLHDKGITHDLNYAGPDIFLNWQYLSSPQLEIRNDKVYFIGSRTVRAGEPFYIVDYKMPDDAELIQKYPKGGIQGYVAIMDLESGVVENAFNTFFHEHIGDSWYTPNQWSFTVPYAFTPEGIVVGYSWGNRYSKDSYSNNERAEDILVGDTVYKGIKRGSLTAAYDWSGNSLWAATAHDAFINSYYFDKNTSKLYAYARLNNLAMIGSAGTENLGVVDVENGINTGFIVYSKDGKLESVNQTTGQTNSEVPFSLSEGQCGTLYIISGVLEKAADPFTDHAYIHNNRNHLRAVSLTGECKSTTTLSVPFTQKYICKGEQVQLAIEGTDIVKVNWYPESSLDDPTSRSPMATPLESTTYYATIETAGGCTVTRAIRIDIDEPLELPEKFIVVTEVLYPRSFKFYIPGLNDDARYEYEWDFGDSRQKSKAAYYEFPGDGTYTVTLKIWNECTAKTITQQVTVPCVSAPHPTAGIGFSRLDKSSISFNLINPQHVESVVWEFGDGSKSTEFSPTHTYALEQYYTVRLTVRSACYENVYYQTVNLNCSTFNVSFVASFNRQRVKFTSDGVPHKAILKWTFGDGNESTEKEPLHDYKETGKYTVTLFYQDECGAASKSFEIEVFCIGFFADFTTVIEQGKVSFKPSANNGSVTYSWDFGDGQVSSENSPVHTYAESGIYRVKLTITDDCGSETVYKEIEICKSVASSDFTYTMDSSSPLHVSFQPAMISSTTAYSWHFGDGGSSSEVSPKYIYSKTGQYLVILITSTGCDQDSVGMTIDIPTGIINDVENKLVNVYPNPAREILYLEMAPVFSHTVSSLTIHDALGRLVYNQTGKDAASTKAVDIRNLSTGSYYLRIRRKDGSFIVKKFVVQQ